MKKEKTTEVLQDPVDTREVDVNEEFNAMLNSLEKVSQYFIYIFFFLISP